MSSIAFLHETGYLYRLLYREIVTPRESAFWRHYVDNIWFLTFTHWRIERRNNFCAPNILSVFFNYLYLKYLYNFLYRKRSLLMVFLFYLEIVILVIFSFQSFCLISSVVIPSIYICWSDIWNLQFNIDFKLLNEEFLKANIFSAICHCLLRGGDRIIRCFWPDLDSTLWHK